MIPLFTTTATAPTPEETPGRAFCAAVGLTADLPDRLIQDGSGRPFAPATLSAGDDPRRLPAQLELLLRPEPVGGAEALVQLNRAAALALARSRLRERLAGGAAAGALAPLLRDLQQVTRQLADDLTRRQEGCAQEYATAHAALRAWQETTTRQAGALQAFAGWIFGGGGRLSLPQAVAIWNERERLALTRLGLSAAGAVCGQVADEVAALVERQAAARQAAERAARQAQSRIDAGRAGAAHYAPWSWRVDVGAVAAQLVTPARVDRAVAELVGQVTEDGGVERLAERARALAMAAAAQAVAPLTLMTAIELEAGAAPIPGADPVVLVGQQLLADLEQRATWQLRRGARTRSELVQITPDGEPIYRMDGLTAAAYGEGADRLGFIELALHAAPEDLRLTQDAAEALAPILALRNLYVLEELALIGQGGGEARGQAESHAQPQSPNGGVTADTLGEGFDLLTAP